MTCRPCSTRASAVTSRGSPGAISQKRSAFYSPRWGWYERPDQVAVWKSEVQTWQSAYREILYTINNLAGTRYQRWLQDFSPARSDHLSGVRFWLIGLSSGQGFVVFRFSCLVPCWCRKDRGTRDDHGGESRLGSTAQHVSSEDGSNHLILDVVISSGLDLA